MKYFKRVVILIVASSIWQSVTAQEKCVINIRADQRGDAISPTMWGVFFEDINMGADGGIYAELVKNRSFEFFKPMMGWTVQQKPFREGAITVLNRQEKNSTNPRFIRVNAGHASKGSLGLTNEGFRGMGIKKDLGYDFSITYRQPAGNIKLHIELVDSNKNVLGSAMLIPKANAKDWTKESVSFTSTGTELKAKLNIWFEGNGIIDLDMISLFPQDTWKKRPGGMRADMIQLLADMKPGFIRFPGGCIVEGFDLSQRYQWKKTIGPIEERQLIINRWNYEFAHRPAPDYFQTFGLGFFEYFQLAEDIGAEPLPILNCGMACQFNTAEIVPLDQLYPYVQDALDLIEFANGDASTPWGKVRAGMGHAAPFNLKMIGIGNENWGPQYIERLAVFQKAIMQKYPQVKLVTSSGTDPNGERFEYLDSALRKMKVDFIDEHYYRRTEWFLQNAGRYDNYDRNGAKIFAGEYAAQSDKTVSVNNKNNLRTAISEAAFLTGLERNAGVVSMASYAPLFAHVDGWQWTPDLIWVDNLRAYGSANYQVQKLYSTNKGTHTLPALSNNKPLIGQDSLYASAVIDVNTKDVIIKIVNSAPFSKATCLAFEGSAKMGTAAMITTLAGENLEAVNTADAPLTIAPQSVSLKFKGRKMDITLPAHSLTVVRIPLK